jgi:hypothetical protein
LVSPEAVYDRLCQLGYTEWRADGLMIEGWPVHFLPAAKSLEREAIEQAVRFELSAGVFARVAAAEYLVALAIDLGRPKDVLRVQQFIHEQAYDPGQLRTLLTRHDLLHKWERIVQKLDQREV